MPNSGSVEEGAGTAGCFVIGQTRAEGKPGVWFGAVAVAAGVSMVIEVLIWRQLVIQQQKLRRRSAVTGHNCPQEPAQAPTRPMTN